MPALLRWASAAGDVGLAVAYGNSSSVTDGSVTQGYRDAVMDAEMTGQGRGAVCTTVDEPYLPWDGEKASTGRDENGVLRCGVCGQKQSSELKLKKHMKTLHDNEQRKRSIRLSQERGGKLQLAKDLKQSRKYLSVVEGLVWVNSTPRLKSQSKHSRINDAPTGGTDSATPPHAPVALNRRVAAALKGTVIKTSLVPNVDAAIVRAGKHWIATLPSRKRAKASRPNFVPEATATTRDLGQGGDGEGGSESTDNIESPEHSEDNGELSMVAAQPTAPGAARRASSHRDPRGCMIIVSSDSDFTGLLQAARDAQVVGVVLMLAGKRSKLGAASDVVLTSPGPAPSQPTGKKTNAGPVLFAGSDPSENTDSDSATIMTPHHPSDTLQQLRATARTIFGCRFLNTRKIHHKRSPRARASR